jgi:hypothetical protein
MAKPNLKDLMAKRNPLTQREAVIPANMYTSPQVVKTTSGQVDKDTSPQVELPTSREVVKPTSKQVGNTTRPLMDKYTTHLRPETIKAVKRVAFESDRKDYEVMQEALDKYLKGKNG